MTYLATCFRVDPAADATTILSLAPASVIVVVDSYGSLYAEQVDKLVRLFRKAMDGSPRAGAGGGMVGAGAGGEGGC